jgi:hypothetical protein
MLNSGEGYSIGIVKPDALLSRSSSSTGRLWSIFFMAMAQGVGSIPFFNEQSLTVIAVFSMFVQLYSPVFTVSTSFVPEAPGAFVFQLQIQRFDMLPVKAIDTVLALLNELGRKHETAKSHAQEPFPCSDLFVFR